MIVVVFMALAAHCYTTAAAAPSLDVRLADGQIAERESRPFQVALYSRVGTTGAVGFCGGSLVHEQWVLTAAHCCYHDGQLVDNVQAILGAYSLYDRYENGRRIVNVEEVVVHPGFDADTFANDLALLRLANLMQLSDTINVVQLPYWNLTLANFAGSAAVVSGWGIAAEGVSFVSPTLRQRTLTVTTDTLCNTYYGNVLPNNIICGLHATAGTCKGDNGGPLTVFNTAAEEDVLVGVASFVGVTGCTVDMPSVFTRVQRYQPWINQVTGLDYVY